MIPLEKEIAGNSGYARVWDRSNFGGTETIPLE